MSIMEATISQRIVIKAEQLSKQYRLGAINHGALYKDLQSWWAALRGREDPNSKIGQNILNKAKRIDKFWALEDLDFEIAEGDRLGIIGPNGAGKSTLLKILSKVTAPTTGIVKIRGRVASLLEVGTGFHPELTGRENVYLNGAILGMGNREITQKFDEIVDFAGVESFIDTPVKRYSSGMYVRLAFSVAAHLEAEVLISDEVLAVGDIDFQNKCLGKMEEISTKRGRTILFVSHNMGMIRRLCNRSMLLSFGHITSHGNTDDVIQKYLTDLSSGLKNSSIDLSNLRNHTGTGEIYVTEIYFEDESDNRLESVVSGSNLRVVLRYKKKENRSLKNIVVSLSLSTSQSLPVSLIHNRMTGDPLAVRDTEGEFVCEIRNLPLVDDQYFLSYSILPENGRTDQFIDSVNTARSFRVAGSTFYRTNESPPRSFGAVMMDASWITRECENASF